MKPVTDEDSPTAVAPILPGLAPVFDSLAREGGLLVGLAPHPSILIGAMVASAIAGNAIRVDLPLQSRARTNPHVMFEGEGRGAAIKLLRIMMSPLEEFITQILDCVAIHPSNRRALQRELLRSQEGFVKLEQRSALLKEAGKDGRVIDAEKELREFASSLGLRYATPAALRRHAAALRLFLRQMIVTSPLELADLNAWSESSLDGHVLELLVEPGQTERMLGLPPKHLAHFARFRLDSCSIRGIVSYQGKIGNHPRLSTLWFADSTEVAALFGNPFFRQHHLADPFVVVNVTKVSGEECDILEFFNRWRGFIVTLFHLRIHEKQVKLTPSPDAWRLLDSWLHDNVREAEWFGEKVALPSLVMVAAINACARHEDIEARSSVPITVDDVKVSVTLLGPDLQVTAQRHTGCGSPVAKRFPTRDLEEILAKLTAKGPLSRRALIRSLHQITAEELNTLLQAGIEQGLIIRCAGKLAAAGSTSCQRVSA